MSRPVMGMKMNDAVTPVRYNRYLGTWAKRDDLYTHAGIAGGKVRACRAIIEQALTDHTGDPPALVTASSRKSPQAQIVARLAAHHGLACRLHMPNGPVTPEMQDALDHGATLCQHRAGYNNVIICRAQADVAGSGDIYIPFGMENRVAMQCTAGQARNLPRAAQRLVVPVGSGMTLAGILWGLAAYRERRPDWRPAVLGVCVGADPVKRLNQWAPPMWHQTCTLVKSRHDYHTEHQASWGTVPLDPVYEAKTVEYLQPGDCLWVVGIRKL